MTVGLSRTLNDIRGTPCPSSIFSTPNLPNYGHSMRPGCILSIVRFCIYLGKCLYSQFSLEEVTVGWPEDRTALVSRFSG